MLTVLGGLVKFEIRSPYEPLSDTSNGPSEIWLPFLSGTITSARAQFGRCTPCQVRVFSWFHSSLCGVGRAHASAQAPAPN